MTLMLRTFDNEYSSLLFEGKRDGIERKIFYIFMGIAAQMHYICSDMLQNICILLDIIMDKMIITFDNILNDGHKFYVIVMNE